MRDRHIITPEIENEEQKYEASIRPESFSRFIGQEKLIENLKIFITAAKKRNDALDHSLFCGPPGLGKTTLAHIIAHEMGVGLKSTSGNVLHKPGDLAGLLTNLQEGDILFIDEIHRLSPAVEEYLYPAMEDFKIDIMIDSGPSARSIKLDLKPFTLIGATTRVGMLTSPLITRFGINDRLDFYTAENLQKIVLQSAEVLKIEMEPIAAFVLGSRCRATPRIANRLLRRCRDVAQVKYQGKITEEVVADTLKRLDVDPLGLDQMDRRILSTIVKNFQGGPVGISTIAIAVHEEADTVEEYYEPFLIQSGLLKRTARGREITLKAYQHLGLNPPAVANKTSPINTQLDLI